MGPFPSKIETRADVVTSSKLKAWWLVNFCGYEVSMTGHQPKEGLFGRMGYVNHWFLERVPQVVLDRDTN